MDAPHPAKVDELIRASADLDDHAKQFVLIALHAGRELTIERKQHRPQHLAMVADERVVEETR